MAVRYDADDDGWVESSLVFSQLSLVPAARESGPGYVCGCYQFLGAPDWKNDIGYITQCGEQME